MIPKRLRWMWLAAPLAVLAVAAAARAATPPAAAGKPPAQPELPTCEDGTLAEVEPAEALVLRLRDRQARIFLEVLAGAPDPSTTVAAVADGAAVLSGPDVIGGIVALALRGECVVGHRFISPLELMDATTVVELHQQRPELRGSEHPDAAGLQKLARASWASRAAVTSGPTSHSPATGRGARCAWTTRGSGTWRASCSTSRSRPE